MIEAGHQYAAEFRRCLINLDVPGMIRLWAHVAPHLSDQSPKDILVAMHIARCEMKYLSPKLKKYSRDWLMERGFQCIDGKWIDGPEPATVYAETVGISVKSSDPRVAKRIHRAMDDALQNARAKGHTEPPMQKEAMLKARAKERFKMRMA